MTNGRNGREPPGHSGVIVVGVDGSESSREALRWAARQAEVTGAEMRAVMSWEIPTAVYWVPFPEGLDLEANARKLLAATVEETLGPDPAVPVSQVVLQGHPAPSLVDESDGAELLVVGSRGHGEFAGMLLGSVSEHCVARAHCPVVVVRCRRRPRR